METFLLDAVALPVHLTFMMWFLICLLHGIWILWKRPPLVVGVIESELQHMRETLGEDMTSLVYALIDPSVLFPDEIEGSEKPLEDRSRASGFYYGVGMTTYDRSRMHILEAIRMGPINKKLAHLWKILQERKPVLVVRLFIGIPKREALTREACMIMAKGLVNLDNEQLSNARVYNPLISPDSVALFGEHCIKILCNRVRHGPIEAYYLDDFLA